jgi:hypothetical protein
MTAGLPPGQAHRDAWPHFEIVALWMCAALLVAGLLLVA